MNNPPKTLLGLLLFVLALTGSGCWNRREVETLAFVLASGVDKTEDGQVRLTVQLAKPSIIRPREGGGGGEPAVWVVSTTGKTTFDAVRNFHEVSPRRLIWSHSEVVVIGEEMARKGMAEFFDFYTRDHDLRWESWILVAQGKAEEVLKAGEDLEKIPAKTVTGLIKYKGAHSKAYAGTVKDFVERLVGKGIETVAGRIEVIQTEGEKGGEGGDKKKKKMLRLASTAVFKKGKMVGWLNDVESRGFLWMKGEVPSGIITVKSPKDGKSEVGFEILRTKAKTIVRVKDAKPSVTVKIVMEANLADQMTPDDLTDVKTIKVLEKRLSTAIRDEALAALKKAREYKADIFGFGLALYREDPSTWKLLEKDWEEEFSGLEVDLEVEAYIRRTGVVTKPVVGAR